MKRLILSCSQRKNYAAGLLAAVDRYDGINYKVLRRFYRSSQEQIDVYVLSARYGLISITEKIPHYDHSMTSSRADELSDVVLKQAEQFFLDPLTLAEDRFFIGLGGQYHRAFSDVTRAIEGRAPLTIANGSSGKRIAQLHDWLYEGNSHLRKAPETHSTNGIIRLGNEVVTLTNAEAMDEIRRSLKLAGAEAFFFHSWFVNIDGVRVSPKWIVSKLTGVSVSRFHSDAARRLLAQLGILVDRV